MANIEIGVLRALKDSQVEAGKSAADAQAWAEAHLKDGVAYAQTLLDVQKRPSIPAVFQQIKQWAQGQ